MTVGDTTEFGDYFTGYRLGGNGNYGSIFPDLNFTYDLGSMSWGSPSNVDAGLFVYFFNGGSPVLTVDSITLYVDGIEYELEYDSENGVHLNASVLLDPFPPAGQTCEIKLRYTLAPEPTFPEVTIGTQTWMSVNLDVDDGLGGIYAYDDNEANVATYGRLYTWDAAVRVAASIDGWHLPSDAEWTTLTTYLGGESVAGGKLKETGTTHWASPNTGATNETGFTAMPGGARDSNGSFSNIGYVGYWWSATEFNAASAWYRVMLTHDSAVGIGYSDKEVGYSIRLIKDTP
jgi:uncharacterized protein (TIGR02145 family)